MKQICVEASPVTRRVQSLTETIQMLLAGYQTHSVLTPQYCIAKGSGQSLTTMKPLSKSGVAPTKAAVSDSSNVFEEVLNTLINVG